MAEDADGVMHADLCRARGPAGRREPLVPHPWLEEHCEIITGQGQLS